MTLKLIFVSLVMTFNARTFGEEYAVLLHRDLASNLADEIEASVREISKVTGSGQVSPRTERGLFYADLSEEGVARVRTLQGVRSVFKDIQFGSMRAPGGVDHVVRLRENLAEHEMIDLAQRLRLLAHSSGNGFFNETSPGTYVVNVRLSEVPRLRTLSGILSVEAKSEGDGPNQCGPGVLM